MVKFIGTNIENNRIFNNCNLEYNNYNAHKAKPIISQQLMGRSGNKMSYTDTQMTQHFHTYYCTVKRIKRLDDIYALKTNK